MANSPGAGLILPSGKGAILASGKGALFNGDGECPACCVEIGNPCGSCQSGTTPAQVLVACSSVQDCGCVGGAAVLAEIHSQSPYMVDQHPSLPCYYERTIELDPGIESEPQDYYYHDFRIQAWLADDGDDTYGEVLIQVHLQRDEPLNVYTYAIIWTVPGLLGASQIDCRDFDTGNLAAIETDSSRCGCVFGDPAHPARFYQGTARMWR